MNQQNKDPRAEGLDQLLNRSGRTNAYFQSLPQNIQEMILQRRQHIETEGELQRYGDNPTGGDQ